MLGAQQINTWGSYEGSNLELPNASDFMVTNANGGVANTESGWTEILSNITDDAWLLALSFSGGGGSATAPQILADIGVDPAGGTSYTAIISNIVAGMRPGRTDPMLYLFPFFCPAGSAFALRHQSNLTTPGTHANLVVFGKPSRPEICMKGSFSETIGTVTNSSGVDVTPGTGAEGSWTEIGTTSKDMWWWELSCQPNDTTTNAVATSFDLAFGDASNKHIIIDNQMFVYGTVEQGSISTQMQVSHYCPVPGGSTMYVRGHCSGTPDAGWNCLIHGIGG